MKDEPLFHGYTVHIIPPDCADEPDEYHIDKPQKIIHMTQELFDSLRGKDEA